MRQPLFPALLAFIVHGVYSLDVSVDREKEQSGKEVTTKGCR